MWRSDQRAGLRFARAADLGKMNAPRWPGPVRVDRVISDTRAELAARKQAELDPGALKQARVHERIAEELALVARRLEGLELDLLGDPAMVATPQLQEIDVSVHTLVHVGRLLTATDPIWRCVPSEWPTSAAASTAPRASN